MSTNLRLSGVPVVRRQRGRLQPLGEGDPDNKNPSVRQRPRRCHTYETRWMTQKVLYEKRRMYGQKIYLYPLNLTKDLY